MTADPCWYNLDGTCYRSGAEHWGGPCPGSCPLHRTRDELRRLRTAWGVQSQPRPMQAPPEAPTPPDGAEEP